MCFFAHVIFEIFTLHPLDGQLNEFALVLVRALPRSGLLLCFVQLIGAAALGRAGLHLLLSLIVKGSWVLVLGSWLLVLGS